MYELERIIGTKSQKGYDNSVGLIVYYDVQDFADETEILPAWKRVIQSIKHSFPSIDLLRGAKLYRFNQCGLLYDKFKEDAKVKLSDDEYRKFEILRQEVENAPQFPFDDE